jgi:hypothetical protein
MIFQNSDEDFEKDDNIIMNGTKFLKQSKKIEALQCFEQAENQNNPKRLFSLDVFFPNMKKKVLNKIEHAFKKQLN